MRLTRYPSIEPAALSDRVLIVAPHMDDEAIGAGAYALDALRAGADVFVAFLTAGDCARFSARILHSRINPSPDDYLSVGRTRIGEAHRAMQILGVPRDHLFILGYPDRGLRNMFDQPSLVVRSTSTQAAAVPYEMALSPGASYTLANLVRDVHRVLDLVRPTTVITPVPFDLHPDHNAAAEIVDMAIDSSPHAPNRLGYLVHTSRFLKPLIWTPERALLPPARMRSFTWATYAVSANAQVVKAAMLDAYKSQRPYTYFLRNAFVRSNELFFAYSPETVQVERAVTSFACAPYSSPSSF
ncbi:MAG TPA: PIG-L family deacetylase [Thermoanaerobaculia bacterium]|nr:PIG-L family deacetylase [Thermoanaerobaculia bacterium]